MFQLLNEMAKDCSKLAAEILQDVDEQNQVQTVPRKRRRKFSPKDNRLGGELWGNVQQIVKELNPGPSEHKNILQMDETCFIQILTKIKPEIERRDTNMRQAARAEDKLSVALRFLSTGDSFLSLNYYSTLSKSSLATSVIEVCDAIYNAFQPEYLKFPETEDDWLSIADDFETMWQIPLCVGAMDARHIAFAPSEIVRPTYLNCKGYASMILLAIADAHAKFIFVDVGKSGTLNNGEALQDSNLRHIFNDPNKYLPREKVIGNGMVLPYFFIADNTFPLLQNLMTPYPFSTIDENELEYNFRLTRARQNIERAFGILANRFRVLSTKIRLKEEKAKKIVLCCCVLHNFLMTNSQHYRDAQNEIAKTIKEEPQTEEIQDESCRIVSRGEQVRDQWQEYFSQESAF